ncbi:hypothetical protein LZ009_10340 [Ramlibacter sp. XY19]|uniref:hypothetical protein n=1 Tax=Ramlibacter paludis TaxID=2908000 RepID=UPI0023DBBF5C|nr:hypothetical protein [Ramlibacter paludis]MCG2593178.1 hypothetical protein [Ramlibacter paludis]
MSPLSVANTVAVAHVRHRLALGIEWFDALAASAVGKDWATELRAVGVRPLLQAFQFHPRGRHALRHAGRLASLLARGAADKLAVPPAGPEQDPTNLVTRAYGLADLRATQYATGNDPRHYVPRRLSLTPVQAGGLPSAGAVNVRQAWVWPGAAYPLPTKASAVRGCVRRGASLAVARPVAWTRVVFTRPGPAPANFNTETRLGHAHGDDRGEFLGVLGPNAVTGGAALPASIALNAWIFVPPAAPAFDAADPLASLPLEVAGTAVLNDVLRGTATPAGYVRHGPIAVTLPLGQVVAIADADLLFP